MVSVVASVVMDPTIFDPRIQSLKQEQRGVNDSVLQEVKRSSEMGLFTLTCNVLKGPEGKQEITSRVTRTDQRLYSTELRLHADAMSAAAIQAIVTSVPRMTRSNIPQTCMSTAEDKQTKTRVPVKFVQVCFCFCFCCFCVGGVSS